jgi:uncharacterized membrane protein (DUF2068 family)
MSLTTHPPTTERARPRDRFIQAIAAFKFFQGILFALAALGALGLMQDGLADRARDWGSELAFGSGQQIVRQVIEFLTNLSPTKVRALGLVALFYAALFATEGIGLWREKRWAEYLTVIATGSLIPLEIWEVSRHPTPIRFTVLAVNVAVVAYLIVRLRHPKHATARRARVPNALRADPAVATPEPEQSTIG